jgi:hypothetical protein
MRSSLRISYDTRMYEILFDRSEIHEYIFIIQVTLSNDSLSIDEITLQGIVMASCTMKNRSTVLLFHSESTL